MAHVTATLAYSGQTISHPLEHVTVVLMCVRPDAAYRVSVRYPSTGAEIDELSQSFACEAVARVKAREICHRFDGGRTVTQVLDTLAEEQRRDALAAVEAELDANMRRPSSAARYDEEDRLIAERDALLPEAVRVANDAKFADMREHILAAWGEAA